MRHIELNPIVDAAEFFDFDISHHSEDLRTMITYIKTFTGFEKVAYVAHSMGTTALFRTAATDLVFAN